MAGRPHAHGCFFSGFCTLSPSLSPRSAGAGCEFIGRSPVLLSSSALGQPWVSAVFSSPSSTGCPVRAGPGPGDFPGKFRHQPPGVPSRGAAAAAWPMGLGAPGSSQLQPQDQSLLDDTGSSWAWLSAVSHGGEGTWWGWGSPRVVLVGLCHCCTGGFSARSWLSPALLGRNGAFLVSHPRLPPLPPWVRSPGLLLPLGPGKAAGAWRPQGLQGSSAGGLSGLGHAVRSWLSHVSHGTATEGQPGLHLPGDAAWTALLQRAAAPSQRLGTSSVWGPFGLLVGWGSHLFQVQLLDGSSSVLAPAHLWFLFVSVPVCFCPGFRSSLVAAQLMYGSGSFQLQFTCGSSWFQVQLMEGSSSFVPSGHLFLPPFISGPAHRWLQPVLASSTF